MKTKECLKSFFVVLVIILVSFIMSYTVCNYHIHPIKEELKSHNHDGSYLFKSSDRALKDYVDSKIETKIRFLRNDLKFKTNNGELIPTNKILNDFFKHYGFKIEYIPPETIKSKIQFKIKDGIH